MNASSSRRYLSVWLRRLATDRLIRGRSFAPAHVGSSRFAQEKDAPLVVVEPVKGARLLSAVNDAAARLGLKPGMGLADARAMYPRIAVADAEPDADHHLLIAIADWCDRYTPLVGLDPPDGLLFDITGCAHLFGGEEALRRDVMTRLARQGFHARAAVADTVGCAWAVARYAESSKDDACHQTELGRDCATTSPPPLWGRDREGGDCELCDWDHPPPHPSPTRGEGAGRVCGTVVPSHKTQEILLPLPLAALRIDAEIDIALSQVGFTCIADVIDRPRAPLAARFGEDFVRRLDQAIGREDEPIAPRLPVPPYVTERRFAEPIAREADVLDTIEHLAHELSRMLERRGEGARTLQAALFRTDGKVHRIVAGTGAPLRDPARIRALFVERLAAIGDACDPGFGYDVVRLGALAVERSDPAQTGLAAPDHAAELAHLIDRLGAHFGLRRVTRLVPRDTHIPEFAVTAVAAVMSKRVPEPPQRDAALDVPASFLRRSETRAAGREPRKATTSGKPSSVTHLRTFQHDSNLVQDSLAPIRPTRLFERAERIEVTAEVPDGPPKQFKWRSVTYHVVNAEGPERIALEWWRDEKGQALMRDYFRIESKEGIRVWLYREGSYIPSPERCGIL